MDEQRVTDKMKSSFEEPNSLGVKALLIILLYGGTLLGLWLGGTRELTYHEVLRAEPAREMIITGDWLLPHMGGMPYTKKPPVINWVIACSILLFGSYEAWVCRLPIVITALINAWMVACLAARWHGRRIGLLTGLIFLSSLYILMQARLAEPDMILCMTVTGSLLCFALAETNHMNNEAKYKLSLVIGYFAFMGLSVVTKFLIGPMFILAGSLLYCVIARRGKALRFIFHPVGWLVMLLIASPWFIAVYNKYPLIAQQWIHEHIGRITRHGGEWGSDYPLLYYFYITPLLLLPWTPWLMGAVITAYKTGMWRKRNYMMVACWFIAGLVCLTIGSWKHQHIIIPVLPVLAIPTAWYLDLKVFNSDHKRSHPLVSLSLFVLPVFVGIWFLWNKQPDIAMLGTIGVVILTILLMIASVCDYLQKPRVHLIFLFAAFWFMGVYVQRFIIGHFDSYRYSTALANRINQTIPEDEAFYLIETAESQIMYFLRWPLVRHDYVEDFQEELKTSTDNEFYIVTDTPTLDPLTMIGEITILDRTEKPARNNDENHLYFLKFQPEKVSAE